MINKLFGKWRWLVGFLVLLLALQTPVLATGIYFHLRDPYFAKDKDSNIIAEGGNSKVQVIKGSRNIPLAGGALNAQTLAFEETIGYFEVDAGEFEYMWGSDNNQSIFLRVWPDGVGDDKYFGHSGAYTTSNPGDGAKDQEVTSITCKFKLSIPAGVNLSVGSYALTYDNNAAAYLPSFVVSPTNTGNSGGIDYVQDPSDANTWYPYDSIEYEIDQAPGNTPDWNDTKTYSSGSIAETDANNPFYIMGNTYAARARATNVRGTGSWGDELIFTIPAGDGTGTQAWSLQLTLYKQANGYGVNDVIIPFNSTYVNGTLITNLQVLKDQIEAAGTKITAIGIWDELSMSLKGATFDADGTPNYTSDIINALTDVTLSAGDAVQVSVDTQVSITLSNQ
ncbi:MAG: hypothetical protein KJ732_00515 [Candidatus Margulisbacteria bacterium]|nr:hypothetical protein [Candidatus Margulisiibacteriota bacterium]